MENWRLSRIEDELGRLNFDSGCTGEKQSSTVHANVLEEPEDDICSKIIIRPAYKKKSRSKEDAHRAVRQIKEKYDSPNAATKSDLNVEQKPFLVDSIGRQELNGQPMSWDCNHSDVNISKTIAPQLNGSLRVVQNLNVSFTGEPSEYHSVSDSLLSPVKESFVFKATTAPISPNEYSDQIFQHNRTPPRIAPPTAAKPFSSSFSRQPPLKNDEVSRLSQVDSKTTNHTLPESTYARPLNLSFVQPLEKNSRSTSIVPQQNLPSFQQDVSPTETFPDPPSDFFAHDTDQEVSVRQNGQLTFTVPSSPQVAFTANAFTKNGHLVNSGNGTSGQHDYFTAHQRLSQTEQRCEFISTETQKIQHLANSYNDCYPRYGTLKSNNHHPSSPTTEVRCEFFPPNSPNLIDEDRNQVEMFYRSHKTRVFAARCEANLYFGSARRHSNVLPSKAASMRVSESPENWLFMKCGIPVLVLDTGESRRQRRLHIIVAEKGSGFVLWRDTVDHLTNYSMSADFGFHTMHLSKDHTKLAGLYFADTFSATEFFDFINNLTSDPNDPLLNLSVGARRRKERKTGSSTKRKEKRKPIRREDISMPCCFTHVTKLDRADGLNLLESEKRLLDS